MESHKQGGRKMKKITMILLILVLTLGAFSGCRVTNQGESTTPSETTAPTTAPTVMTTQPTAAPTLPSTMPSGPMDETAGDATDSDGIIGQDNTEGKTRRPLSR